MAVDIACMALYGPAPGLKGRTFELWVLNRWIFKFCTCNQYPTVRKRVRERKRENDIRWSHIVMRYNLKDSIITDAVVKLTLYILTL